MSSISLPPGRSAPLHAVDQESVASFRGLPTRPSLRVEPEIMLGGDRLEGEEEAPPLTMVGGGVTGGALERLKGKRLKKESGKKEVGKKEVGKKEVGRWKFWKRPSRRSRELEEFRRGCERLAETVGSIREEMVAGKIDRAQLHRTLSPLPVAAAGLQRIGEAQEKTVKVLGGVQESLRRAEEKDAVFFKTMDRFGNSMSNMDMVVVGMGRAFSSIERTGKESVRNMERLTERLDASDRFLEQTFLRLRETEREFAGHMVANARRSALVTVTICLLLMAGIAMLTHTLGNAKPHVTVVRDSAAGAVKEAGGDGMPPLDWQILPREGRTLAEDKWPLDLSGQEPHLLFVNKFPGE